MTEENNNPSRFTLSGLEAVVIIILLSIAAISYALKNSTPKLPTMPDITPTDSTQSNPYSSTEPKDKSPYFIKINQYSLEMLKILPNVGDAAASRIIHYRNTVGDIKNFQEFIIASGLTPNKASVIEPFISYESRAKK